MQGIVGRIRGTMGQYTRDRGGGTCRAMAAVTSGSRGST